MGSDVPLSIIVPVLNGASFIPIFFEALRKQTAPRTLYQLVIVDNGSSDDSLQLLNNISIDNQLIVIAYSTIRSSYAARNFGVAQTDSAYLAFTDIDCVPRPDWIETCLANRAQMTEGFILAGNIEVMPKGRYFTPIEWFDASNYLGQKRATSRGAGLTANLAFARTVFDELGGFNETVSGGDTDFCRRSIAAGHPLSFVPQLIVGHPARSSLQQMSQKIDRIANGLTQLDRRSAHPRKIATISLMKQLLLLVLQPQLFRTGASAIRGRSILSLSWLLRLVFVSIYLGSYLRLKLILGALKIVLLGGAVRKTLSSSLETTSTG